MTKDIEIRTSSAIASQDELSIEQLTEQVAKIQGAMKAVMKDGEHYGVIPGTKKPSLLKPGAEKLCLLFRLAPTYRREVTWHDDGHMTVIATCSLKHISTEALIAEGDGMCSTKEKKYAYRTAERLCPNCGQPFLLKSNRPGEGWFCWKNPSKGKDGCGAKFPLDDERIAKQEQGKVENPDLADTYNTVLKMACKRALVAAVLNGTAASDIFTQDVEDSAVVEPQTNQSVEGEPSTGGGARTSPPSAKPEGGEPDASNPAPAAPSGLTEEEERDAKDRLQSLIEQAVDGGITVRGVKLTPGKVGAKAVRLASSNGLPMPKDYPDFLKTGTLALLQLVVDDLELEKTVGTLV